MLSSEFAACPHKLYQPLSNFNLELLPNSEEILTASASYCECSADLQLVV